MSVESQLQNLRERWAAAKPPERSERTPDSELSCTWIGPNRGLRRYRSSDIIAYLEAGPRRPSVDPKLAEEATG